MAGLRSCKVQSPPNPQKPDLPKGWGCGWQECWCQDKEEEEEEAEVRTVNLEWEGAIRDLSWPAETADGDIEGAKSFSQMALKPIFSRNERREQISAIRKPQKTLGCVWDMKKDKQKECTGAHSAS